MKRSITHTLLLSTPLFFSQTLFVQAQAVQYDPITPGVPGDINLFINWFVQTAINLGAAIAVLMIVIGGFRILLMAGNPSARQAAKQMTFNALFGLGILILSYLILNTINPDMVSFSF